MMPDAGMAGACHDRSAIACQWMIWQRPAFYKI
jgi:hypothetical protein